MRCVKRWACSQEKVLDEDEVETEEFEYAHADKFYIDRLKAHTPRANKTSELMCAPWQDEIVLNSDLTQEEDIIAKCAISHGLALGVKLAFFEEAVIPTRTTLCCGLTV